MPSKRVSMLPSEEVNDQGIAAKGHKDEGHNPNDKGKDDWERCGEGKAEDNDVTDGDDDTQIKDIACK